MFYLIYLCQLCLSIDLGQIVCIDIGVAANKVRVGFLSVLSGLCVIIVHNVNNLTLIKCRTGITSVQIEIKCHLNKFIRTVVSGPYLGKLTCTRGVSS